MANSRKLVEKFHVKEEDTQQLTQELPQELSATRSQQVALVKQSLQESEPRQLQALPPSLKREQPLPLMGSQSKELFSSDLVLAQIHRIKGVRVGYFAFASFLDPEVITIFDKLLEQWKSSTDLLVIDTRQNLGGRVDVCYSLLSRLTDRPLPNAIESILIDEAEASQSAQVADSLEELLEEAPSDQALQSLLGFEELDGVYISRPLVQEKILYYRSIVEEWEQGRTCTRFLPICGASTIQPHPTKRYTKPIVLMTDELTASCGDLFAAILKDSGRAELVGRTTIGAGGSVRSYEMPNFTGIQGFSLTRSLALRSNHKIIEDLGVCPHYFYNLSSANVLRPEKELSDVLQWAAQRWLERKGAQP